MSAANAPSEKPEHEHAQVELDRRYGRIGISALAAALPYQGDSKNPAYAPVAPRQDETLVRFAAA